MNLTRMSLTTTEALPQRRPLAAWTLTLAAMVLGTGFFAGACAPSPDETVRDGAVSDQAAEGSEAESEPVVVYSGRGEKLIGPILERYQEQTGAELEVRYASTSELAATLLEEGASTPADIFISQDAAALGTLSKAGMLKPLPADLVGRVEARFRAPDDTWVGLSCRARAIVYNPERITVEELPKTLEEIADPRFKGRFGIAPANASFQAHMAVVSAVEGEQALKELLAGLAANDPKIYSANYPIVEATINGEVDFGLVNHYYLYRALDETPDAPGKNFYMTGGADGFVNVAGMGVLSDNPAALALARYLLDPEAQRFFAEHDFEYPLAAGAEPIRELKPLSELATPDVDYARVTDALPGTLKAISASGLLR